MDERTTHMVFATAALAAVAAVLAGPAGAYIPEGTGVQPVAAQSNERQAQSAGMVVVPYLSHGIGVDKSQFSGQASRTLAGGQAQQGVDVAIRTAIAASSESASQTSGETIPYLSQGVGVDKSQFSGGRTTRDGRVAAMAARNVERIDTALARGKSGAELLQQRDGQAIPYLSQGMGVDESQFAGKASQRLGGVHGALTLNRHENTSVAPLPHGIQVVLSPPSESQSLGLTGDSPLTRVSAPEPEGLTGDSALTRVPEAAPAPTVSGGEDIDWTSFGAGAGMVALVAAGLVGILLTARRRHTVGLP